MDSLALVPSGWRIEAQTKLEPDGPRWTLFVRVLRWGVKRLP